MNGKLKRLIEEISKSCKYGTRPARDLVKVAQDATEDERGEDTYRFVWRVV